jgi:mannose-6-phosphate isomerase
MPSLYPFLMLPIFDERPWGVRDLRPVYTKVVNAPIGESWLTWEDNRVANGPLAGRSLADLAKQYRRELVGTLACHEDRFPLLVKFLFPGDKLSVQVHPDDEQARKSGRPCGKTECWYVLRAEPGAQVALGLKPGTTLEDFRRAIEETRAEELLNWVDVFAGDMIYVAAGTVHTIGGGMVLVETQQTSDTTYRLYDYGRGRELHIEDGLAATKLHTHAGKVVSSAAPSTGSAQARQRREIADQLVDSAALQRRVNAGHHAVEPASAGANLLVRSPFFQVEKMPLRQPLRAETTPASPHILVAVSGAGIVASQGMEPVTFASGDAVIIPACVGEYSVRPQWELEIMRMSLPETDTPEPQTSLPQSASAK